MLGKKYRVLDDPKGYVEKGTASYYGQKFHGRRTSNLEVYDMYAFTAAHKTLPLPSFARVTNLDNGKSVVVRVNDRGPFHDGRVIDLSYAAAVKLGITQRGTGRVEVRRCTPGDVDDRADRLGFADRTEVDKPVARRRERKPQPTPIRPAWSRRHARSPAPRAGELTAGRAHRHRQADTRQSTCAPCATIRRLRRAIAGGRPTAAAAEWQRRGPAGRQLRRPRQCRPRAGDTAQAPASTAPSCSDVNANGQTIWRLRVGPLQAAQAPELAARIAGLGFGQPQRVRD